MMNKDPTIKERIAVLETKMNQLQNLLYIAIGGILAQFGITGIPELFASLGIL